MIWATIVLVFTFFFGSAHGNHDAQYAALDKFINANINNIITSLQGAVQQHDAAGTLQYTLTQAQQMGFAVKNINDEVGYVEYGSGTEYVAVLCHLDTLPPVSGWTTDPYSGVLAQNYIIGNGAYSAKGPAFSALWALNAIKENNVKLNKRVRIIFGTDEETGMYRDCITYNAYNKAPIFGFSTAGTYPGNYINSSDKSLSQLVLVYNTFTKSQLQPTALRLGSYALAIPNIVGFGGALQNVNSPNGGRYGGPDERLDISNGLMHTTELYAREIFEMAQ